MVSECIGTFLLHGQRNSVGDMVLGNFHENKGKGMINFVAILDIVMVLAVLAAVAGLVRRTNNYFMVSTRLLLGCLLFFMLLYGTCLAIEWLGITSQLDAFEDYIGALLPMWWAFVYYAFLRETDLRDIKALNRELEQRVESLEEAELRFRTIFQSASDGILIAQARGQHFFSANEKMCKMLGYTKEELLSMSVSDIHPKESIAYVHQQFARIVAKEVPVVQNIPLLKKDKTVFFADVSGSAMNVDKEDYLIGIFRDITERKQAEEKLRKSEANLKEAQTQTHIGSWEVDIAGRKDFWSDEMYRIFEIDPQSGQRSFADILSKIHPDDRERIGSGFKQALAGQKPLHDEFRIVLSGGRQKIIEARGNPVFDDNGRMTHYIGTSQDITERKQAEEKLRQSLEQLRRAINTTIQVLVSALEARDPYTTGHQSRATDLACTIAEEMELAKEQIEGIHLAGIIHDIGKLSVPAEILSKPTRLTTLEFDLIKQHPQSGFEMLKNVESPWPLAQIVYQHHERINGTGYPRKLKGDDILLEARILAVADVVEAMASHRPYRPSLGIDVAIEEIEKNRGILYDAAAVDACIKLFREKGYHLTDGG